MSQGSGGGRSFQVLNPPNLLKQKVGSGGLDANAIKKAEKVFDSLRGEFEELATTSSDAPTALLLLD